MGGFTKWVLASKLRILIALGVVLAAGGNVLNYTEDKVQTNEVVAQSAIETAIAETLQFILQETADALPSSTSTPPPSDTPTSTPTESPTPSNTPTLTTTPTPKPTHTPVPIPTRTPMPIPTRTPVPFNQGNLGGGESGTGSGGDSGGSGGNGGGNCDPAYPTVCIPPSPPDLDCGDIPFRRFTVLSPDPHRFDGNHDGVGCESN